MAALQPVLVTDTVSQEITKINAIVNTVNNIAPGTNIFQLVDPINDQDILVYSTGTQLFTNTSINALVVSILANQTQTSSQLKPYYWASLRTAF